MTISMYQASVPVFVRALKNLSANLDKGMAFANARKIDPSVLLNLRLAPDMLPLVRQVQIATDGARGLAARLAGVERPAYEDNETTFDELQARIARTIAFLETFQPAQIDGTEAKSVTLPLRGKDRTFDGQSYLLQFALPNVFFHVTTAYAILRHAGVELGKPDFLGALPGD